MRQATPAEAVSGEAIVGSEPAYYRWVVAFAGMLVTTAFGVINSYSVFFPSLSDEFGWNRAQVASVFSVYTIAYSAAVIPMGRLVERLGPRRVVLFGTVLAAAGFSLSGAVHTLWQMRLTYGVIAGIGASALWTAPMFVVSQWFQDDKHRGLALGIVASAALGITFPLITSHLIEAIGWRYAYAVTGLIVLTAVIVALFFLKTPRFPTYSAGEKSDIGSSRTRVLSLSANDFTVAETLRTRQFWILYIAYGLGLFGLSMAQVHMVPLAIDRDISAGLAAGALTLAVMCGMGGRIVLGAVSDRIGTRRVLVTSYAIQALALLWLILLNQAWMLLGFAFLLGLAWGGWITSHPPIIGEYFGLKHFTTILAIGTSNFAFGAAVGPYIAGYIFDKTGSYSVPLAMAAFLSLVSFVMCCLLTIPSRPSRHEG